MVCILTEPRPVGILDRSPAKATASLDNKTLWIPNYARNQ